MMKVGSGGGGGAVDKYMYMYVVSSAPSCPWLLMCTSIHIRMVILDPILTDAISKRGEAPPTELTWQQIMRRILEEMRQGYSIQQGADKLYR